MLGDQFDCGLLQQWVRPIFARNEDGSLRLRARFVQQAYQFLRAFFSTFDIVKTAINSSKVNIEALTQIRSARLPSNLSMP